jgi:ankyrin repeat protein
LYCSLLEKHRDEPEELDINCTDPLNRTALITAIENENVELMRILLEWNIDVKVRPAHHSASATTRFTKADQMLSGIIHSTCVSHNRHTSIKHRKLR